MQKITSDSTVLEHDVQEQSQPLKDDTERIVLIVDDDPDFLFQHSTLLKSLGFTVVTAESRSEAVERLDEMEPTLAMVDLMMEESDSGFTLCYEIKQRYPETPIIVVTSASALTGYDFEALRGEQRTWVRADAVLSKPVRFDQLTGQVNQLLDR